MIATTKRMKDATVCITDNPADWGPPEAPLYMPVQNLATPRFKLTTQLRQVLLNLRNGSRREI